MVDITSKYKSKSNTGRTLAQLRVTDALIVGEADVSEELEAVSGMTTTGAELNTLDGAPLAAVITPGAADSGLVTIQLNDGNGVALAVRGAVYAYLSDDANGDSIAATAPSGGVAIGTDGVLIPLVADKAFILISEADGDIDLAITEAGTDTFYLIIVLPTGKLVASAAITFAA